MSTVQKGRLPTAPVQRQSPNAEQATAIAINFLKRLGNKRGLKPRRVTLEGQRYIVEVEFKKHTATVQIDSVTKEIKEYEIEKESGESISLPLSLKTILFVCGIVILLHLILDLLNIWSLLGL